MMDPSKSCEEDELMLELSIGGIFGKPNLNTSESIENDTNNNNVDLNVQPALRPRDLRRKKKAVDFGSSGSVTGPFVENKEWFEGQIVGQNGEPARKKEKIGVLPEKVSTAPVDDGGGHVVAPDGGATDDSRSYSSNSQLDHRPLSNSTASVEPFDQSEQPTGSSKQTVTTTKLTTDSNGVKPNELSNPHESSIIHPPPRPEASSHHEQASIVLARMPCVSTTGNGPNGKTVSGFLYRYTKNEVIIVCVCHGRLFSPAAFVEHAGGVDIAHPLKHITIFPAALT